VSTLAPPSARFEADGLLDGLCLLTTSADTCNESTDMGGEGELAQELPHFRAESDTFERCPRHLEVDAIRSIDCETEGDSCRVRQHAALLSLLTSVRRVWPRFLAHQPRPPAFVHSRNRR